MPYTITPCVSICFINCRQIPGVNPLTPEQELCLGGQLFGQDGEFSVEFTSSCEEIQQEIAIKRDVSYNHDSHDIQPLGH